MQMTCNTLIEQQDLLAIFDLPSQEQQDTPPALVWHCAWCMPYPDDEDGATSGICAECEARYFPPKGSTCDIQQ